MASERIRVNDEEDKHLKEVDKNIDDLMSMYDSHDLEISTIMLGMRTIIDSMKRIDDIEERVEDIESFIEEEQEEEEFMDRAPNHEEHAHAVKGIPLDWDQFFHHLKSMQMICSNCRNDKH